MKKIKFFDFCSGIGGGRIGLEKNGFECVGHCEVDEITAKTYEDFFGDNRNYGDLTEIDIKTIPDFDFLIAGFPCQTFSIAGKREGFNDKRGQIIYSLFNIMKEKRVKYFLLENVKGLVNHNKGETLKSIKFELEKLGYNVYIKVLNSVDYGVPQSRERVYIVGLKKELDNYNFDFPLKESNVYKIEDFIDFDNELELDTEDETFLRYLSNKYNIGKNYTITEILKLENYILDTRQSDFRIYKEHFPTLRTGRHGLFYIRNGKIKKLSGYEALLLQGFPKNIAQKVKDNNKYLNNKVLSQAGNAMTVNVIEKIGREMKNSILSREKKYNGRLFG